MDDYWVVKIDSIGNKQWDRRFGGTENDDLYTVRQTTDGGFILGGKSQSGISGDKTQSSWGSYDYWILKIDSFGNKLWDKRYGGTDDDQLFSLHQTVDGGYIIGGYSNSDSSGDKSQASQGSHDFWILKIDSIGNKLWDKRFGGTNSDMLCTLLQTTDHGYILGGYSNSINSGDKTQASWGDYDYWIVKTDSIGNKIWDKDYGGIDSEEFYSISTTSDNGYLFSGDSYSNISGNKTENNLGVEQAWIIKTDSIGNKQWDKTILTNGHDEQSFAIQTKDSCYAIANSTFGGVGGDKTQPSWSASYDFWIIKFCDTTQINSAPIINLSCTDTSFCEKHCIDFFDLCTNNPTSWQWFFTGSDSLTSTLQNPTNICYSTYGSFDVTLIACNAAGCDTLILPGFINEYPLPNATITQSNDTLFSSLGVSYQWWSTDSGLIAGATNSFFVPSQTGNYFVVVADSIGCEGTSNIISITGINEFSVGNLHLAITPNPAKDIITITATSLKNLSLSLYDLTGKVFLQKQFDKKTEINFSELSGGIYFVKVVDEDGNSAIKKLIKF